MLLLYAVILLLLAGLITGMAYIHDRNNRYVKELDVMDIYGCTTEKRRKQHKRILQILSTRFISSTVRLAALKAWNRCVSW